MPPVEAWKKVLLAGGGADAFFASSHGEMECTDCHDGDAQAQSMGEAHAGLLARPSAGDAQACAQCHAEATYYGNSMHAELWGEKTLLAKRHGVASFSELPEAVRHGFGNECATCHASCGDCHVSRPAPVGGGLIDGHLFRMPDMTLNCTACHGSRVGMEYRGENAGVGADVHFVPGAMRCEACHTGAQMHGDGTVYAHRLDDPRSPACVDCHAGVSTANAYHSVHWDGFQCQVCHSQEYKSCGTCHAGSGLSEPSTIGFKIGRNPEPRKRPFDFVVLRHAPVAPDTYREWGTAQLPNYSGEPTWKYAAPHNIRRWTPRTMVPEGGTCSTACHGTPDGVEGFFLRQADLDAMTPVEADANRDLVVPDGSPTQWQ